MVKPEQTPTDNTTGGGQLPWLVAGFVVMGMVMAGALLWASGPDDDGTATPRPARVAGGQNAVVGWEVPDFGMQLLDDAERNISDYQGQVVFLNFWATWCVPCQREMPAFAEFMAEGREDAVILAVNNGEAVEDVRDFRQLFGLQQVPIVLDEGYVISDGFGVVNLPVTYVLGPDGVVRAFHLGEITREDIDAYLVDILGAA